MEHIVILLEMMMVVTLDMPSSGWTNPVGAVIPA
jgi:hypothetical protein